MQNTFAENPQTKKIVFKKAWISNSYLIRQDRIHRLDFKLKVCISNTKYNFQATLCQKKWKAISCDIFILPIMILRKNA